MRTFDPDINLIATRSIALALLCVLAASPAFAGWAPEFIPPGVSSDVFELAVHDGRLIAAGWFGRAGDISSRGIAQWDGRQWQSMGGSNYYRFSGFAEFRGDLYAIGGFGPDWNIFDGTMARWDGSSWEVLTALDVHLPIAVVSYDGDLVVAAGWVVTAEGDTIRTLARWDGSDWTPVGGGFGGNYPHVGCLSVHNGVLYAGGEFTEAGGRPAANVASWDGEQWSPMGEGTNQQVMALAWYGDGLVAGGSFTRADDDSVNGIAWWRDGAWRAMGAGMTHRSRYPRPGYVSVLTVWGDRLIAGGEFEYAGDAITNSVAAWNGVDWETLGPSGPYGPGMINEVAANGTAPVRALAVFGDKLYAGGSFAYAGGLYTRNIASFDGARWSKVGGGVTLDGTVEAVADFQGLTVFGGSFVSAGDTTATLVAGWDGDRWLPLGDGLWNGDVGYPFVSALTEYEGGLLAAWNSRSGCSGTLMSVMRWDGSGWSAWDPGLEVEGYIGDMVTYRGDLVVAGNFSRVGDISARNIARWDGAEWHAMGEGVDDRVYSLFVQGDTLYVGGNFRNAGGEPANFIAAWDGEKWSTLVGGTGGTVLSMATLNDELVVGGYFWVANGVHVNSIARWSGGKWRPLGPGFQDACWGDPPSRPAAVEALIVYRDRLIAGGSFCLAGADTAEGVACWNGTYWVGIRDGFAGDVRCALPKEDGFFLGGYNYVTDQNVMYWEGALPAGPEAVEGLAAENTATGVQLTWRTPRVDGVQGFRVERKVGIKPWERASASDLEPSTGDNAWGEDLPTDWAGISVGYRVVPILLGGDDAASVAEVSVEFAPGSPPDHVLGAPHPNPFRGGETTRVAFTVPRTESTRLDVLNAAGRLVRTLVLGAAGPGTVLTDWDGRDDRGARVAAGVYLLHLVSGDYSATRRVVVLH